MQPSSTSPVTSGAAVSSGAVVEEVRGGWSRVVRRVAATAAGLAVLVAGTALWEYGRRAGDTVPADPGDVVLFATFGHYGGEAWLRRRTRRGDLRWRRALPLPGGTRPGLVARRSRRSLAIDAVGLCGLLGGTLVFSGSAIDGWLGRITTAICVVALPLAALAVFQRLRCPVLVAVTSRGVVAEGEELPWELITSVRRGKDGVDLRLREDGEVRHVSVGGHECTVSNERLADVIAYYLDTPHRRSTLDLNAPGPLPAVR
ncbi:hypothetical protein [Phytohabitans houttuyneae]|uniref:Uncharacterized protein n=1 Tax=Phytohabitans houttuyneae TaxID=1076126 RepID=A0A6V8KDE2_9ACTN|nr:hypothetical protein [Phytohabitans houttuyneae]GFJ78755.1 hypothetical protein Phou_029350 [Phytohabitans houttuyneae]